MLRKDEKHDCDGTILVSKNQIVIKHLKAFQLALFYHISI